MRPESRHRLRTLLNPPDVAERDRRGLQRVQAAYERAEAGLPPVDHGDPVTNSIVSYLVKRLQRLRNGDERRD